MESKLFSIGDIVTLKTHPYIINNTTIIYSADHFMLPPLMIVTEIFKAKQSFKGVKLNCYKYKCIWFSPKSYKFIDALIYEEDLKLIFKCSKTINKNILKRGDKITLKTTSYELGKMKSSLTYEDNSMTSDTGSTSISSLLSFMSPILQVTDLESYKCKFALEDKKLNQIRIVSAYDVKCILFDPNNDKVSEYTLPIESLELIVKVDETIMVTLKHVIDCNGFLRIKYGKFETLARPRNITYRGGYYFLRAYDYLSNKVKEFEIKDCSTFEQIPSPFTSEAPQFDITNKPEAATARYIANEIMVAIKDALTNFSYIRIEYKNRNGQISQRTLKNFDFINVKEDDLEVCYLEGFCLLRQSKRSFRIERIQNIQILDLSYKLK